MACDSTTCGSSSCGSQEACCAPQKKPTGSQLVFCVKCKEGVVARVVANQSEPMCLGCLHASLLSKFKTAINNHSLVTPSDNVLLAFSGGPASRVALEFLREIRSKAQSDKDASRDQRSGLTVFGLGVVFVNEAAVLQVSSADAQLVEDKISSIVCTGSPRLETLHIARLEDVFKNECCASIRSSISQAHVRDGGLAGDAATAMETLHFGGELAAINQKENPILSAHSAAGSLLLVNNEAAMSPSAGTECGITSIRGNCMVNENEETRRLSQRLRALLESVQDMTGREDLIEYLRMQVLQQVCSSATANFAAILLCIPACSISEFFRKPKLYLCFQIAPFLSFKNH
jgi:hypothetical protein